MNVSQPEVFGRLIMNKTTAQATITWMSVNPESTKLRQLLQAATFISSPAASISPSIFSPLLAWSASWHMFSMVANHDGSQRMFIDGEFVGEFPADQILQPIVVTTIGNTPPCNNTTSMSNSSHIQPSFASFLDDLELFAVPLTDSQLSSRFLAQQQQPLSFRTIVSKFDKLRPTICVPTHGDVTSVRTPRDLKLLFAQNCTTLAGSVVIDSLDCTALFLSINSSSRLLHIEGSLTIQNTFNCSLDTFFPDLVSIGEAAPPSNGLTFVGNVGLDFGTRSLREVVELVCPGKAITITDTCVTRFTPPNELNTYWAGLNPNLHISHPITDDCPCAMRVTTDNTCTSSGPFCHGGAFSDAGPLVERLSGCEVMVGDLTLTAMQGWSALIEASSLRVITGTLTVADTELPCLWFLENLRTVGKGIRLSNNKYLVDATLPQLELKSTSVISVNNPLLCPGGLPFGNAPCNDIFASFGVKIAADKAFTRIDLNDTDILLAARQMLEYLNNGILPPLAADALRVVCFNGAPCMKSWTEVWVSLEGSFEVQHARLTLRLLSRGLDQKQQELVYFLNMNFNLYVGRVQVMFSTLRAAFRDYSGGLMVQLMDENDDDDDDDGKEATLTWSYPSDKSSLLHGGRECGFEYRPLFNISLTMYPPFMFQMLVSYYASIGYSDYSFEIEMFTRLDPVRRVDNRWQHVQLPGSACLRQQYKLRYCTDYTSTVVMEGLETGGYSRSANCFLAGLPVEIRMVVAMAQFEMSSDNVHTALMRSAVPVVLKQRPWVGRKDPPPVFTGGVVPFNGDTLNLAWKFNHPSSAIKEFQIILDTEWGIAYPDRISGAWSVSHESRDSNDTYHFALTGCFCGTGCGCDSPVCRIIPNFEACLNKFVTVNIRIIPVLLDAQVDSSAEYFARYEIGQQQVGLIDPIWVKRISNEMQIFKIPENPETNANFDVWCPIIEGFIGVRAICNCTESCQRQHQPWEGSMLIPASQVDQAGHELPQNATSLTADIVFTSSPQYLTVQNLPPFTSIKCMFYCLSDFGEDSLGDHFLLTTEQGIPDRPAPPNITDVDSKTWNVSWTAPRFPTGVIVAYMLYDYRNALVYSGLQLSYNISKSSYASTAFTLTIATEAGESPHSDPAVDLGSASSSSFSSTANGIGNLFLYIVVGAVLGAVVFAVMAITLFKGSSWWGVKSESLHFPDDEWLLDATSALMVDRSSVLGRGAFGVVCLGILRESNNFVAIKSCARTETARDFLQEAECLKQLSRPGHENVVRLIGVCNSVRLLVLDVTWIVQSWFAF